MYAHFKVIVSKVILHEIITFLGALFKFVECFNIIETFDKGK